MLLSSEGMPLPGVIIFSKVVVQNGVGMNFRPSPKRERRLGGGLCSEVRSWKARLVGLQK